MQPVAPLARQPVIPTSSNHPPFGSPGSGTSGGLLTGGLQVGSVGGFQVPPPQVPNQNLAERYRQYQMMQGMVHPQFQSQFQQLPGWAGYLQWLRNLHNPHPAPIMPGGVPGPVRS